MLFASVAIEVTQVPTQVHLELLAVVLHLHFVVELVLGELLLNVDQPLDINDVHVVHVGNSVYFLDQTGLFFAETELLLLQNLDEIVQFNDAFLSFKGLGVEIFDEPGPDFRILVNQLLINVAE